MIHPGPGFVHRSAVARGFLGRPGLRSVEANGLVFSELLVSQLKSEARGDGIGDRPLYRLASAAPSGKIAQRFTMEAVSRFVATLD